MILRTKTFGSPKENTTYSRKGALTTARPLLVNARLTGETCGRTSPILAIPPRARGPDSILNRQWQHKRKVNERATECATHIFPSKNRNSRTLKICSSPSPWMDGVFRAVRWVMRGFDAADSERTVQPESPTSPRQHHSISHANQNNGKGGKGKENTTYSRKGGR